MPEADVFFVPFLFRDHAHARAVLDGPIGQEVSGRVRGARDGRPGLVGAGLPLHLERQAPDPDPGGPKGSGSAPQNAVVVEALRSLSAEVVPMPWGKALLDALAQGGFDGSDIDVSLIRDFEVFRSQAYLSLTGHSYRRPSS